MIFELVIYTVKNIIAEKISYAVVEIVASTKSELSKISQVKFFSYSWGYSLTEMVNDGPVDGLSNLFINITRPALKNKTKRIIYVSTYMVKILSHPK